MKVIKSTIFALACIVENYKYSNCGKWKVLEADVSNKYEVYHNPATKDALDEENGTSDERNSTSDEEYQSG
jgi:hypothetical protein